MRPLQYDVLFAVVVDFIWILGRVNSQVRNGRFSSSGTKVSKTEEHEIVDDVVVVTGGSSGLGQIIAEIFALKGISVAILDIKKPQMEGNYALQYYHCDVSDWDQVERTTQQIITDVRVAVWMG